MKNINNNIIPFKGFKCINICGFLFIRNDVKLLTDIDINHEAIHSAQMHELLYIFFYVISIFEWLFRVLFTKDAFSHKAYRNISFEKEAYDNEENYNYLSDRAYYAQWKENYGEI